MKKHRYSVRARRAASAVCAMGIMVACASTGDSSAPTDAPATGMISAREGGTIRTQGGIVLEVPPGAVPNDTSVTVTPIDARASGDAAIVAGARFEPDGLELLAPATLRLPFTSNGTNPPIELVFRGSDARNAMASGIVADVSSRTHAVLSIWHFSGNICARNCHGGTREFLTARLAAKGLDLTACVTSKYPSDLLPAKCEDIHSDQSVQAILGTFFEEQTPSCCDAGQDVPSAQLAQLAQLAASGRNVVIAFQAGGFGTRGGDHGFYPSMNHTATIEIVGGVPMLRNTVVVPTQGGVDILALLGGTNLTYWPLAELNRFRTLHSGEALEIAACKDLPEAERPGCLSAPHGPFHPLAVRPIPWSAVRIFVEREKALDCTSRDAGPDASDAASQDAAVCPTYPPNTVGYCAGESSCPPGGGPCACPSGSEFCCSEGFCYTRDIAGCTQAVCPPGAGRTYTDHCCCDCWDDKSTVGVYDPCRPGFLLRCEPRR